jgi:hypothetical protein
MNAILVVGTSTINIGWSHATNNHDFLNYKIYRKENAGVSTSDTLVTTITDIDTVSFQDTGLLDNKTY